MTINFYNQKPNGRPNDNGTFIFDKNLTLQEFEEKYNKEYLYYEDFFQKLKIDETYYMITDDNQLFGVFVMHKGFTFIDCMEHDNRVRVKQMFSHLKCNIFGEEV